MGKIKGLSALVRKLPNGFLIDENTGILYYLQGEVKEKIGKVAIPEDGRHPFLIYFDRFGKEKSDQYHQYWESLYAALSKERISNQKIKGLVLMLAPIPRLDEPKQEKV